MGCTSSTCPDFFFDHSGPNPVWLSPDIDAGTDTLQGNQSYTIKVKVHNNGANGYANIQLWAAPPGTNVLANGAYPIYEGLTQYIVPACSGTTPGVSPAGSWEVNWTPSSNFPPNASNTIHTCLFAKVGYKGSLGCPAVAGPTSDDCSLPGNAQHNINIVGVQFKMLVHKRRRMRFAFGIVNPLDERLGGIVLAGPPAKPEALLKHPSLAVLRKNGRLRADAKAAVTLGTERIVVPAAAPRNTIRPYEADRIKQPVVYRLGHTGEVNDDVFEALKDGKSGTEQQVELTRGEIRQAFVEIEAPDNAKPGDFFITEILHQVKRGKRAAAIGGLGVVLRIDGPDEKPRKRG